MKDSKLFIAGIVAFALALGVILGNFCSTHYIKIHTSVQPKMPQKPLKV